ncbi:MAG: hypothetical protein Roseis2KO_39230 [Roseivirga sp.]
MIKKCLFALALVAAVAACKETDTLTPKASVQNLTERFEGLEAQYNETASNSDSTLYYSQQLRQLATEINKPAYTAKAWHYLGNSAFKRSQYDSAGQYLQKSIDLSYDLQDTFQLALSLEMLGTNYQFQTKLTQALESHQEAARLRELMGDQVGLGRSYNSIANVLSSDDLMDPAIEYYQKAIAIAKEHGRGMSVLPPTLNVSLIYLEQEAYQKALDGALEVKERSKELGSDYGIGKGAHVAGQAYLAMNEMEKAETETDLALSVFKKLGTVEQYSLMHLKAEIYVKKKQYQQALRLSDELLKMDLNTGLKEHIYEMRYKVFKQLGQEHAALTALENYTNLYEEITESTLKDQTVKFQTAFDTQMKNREINQLKAESEQAKANIQRRNLWLLITSVSLVVAALLAYFIIQNLKAKSEKKLIEVENRLLRSQLNPHFIFNAMAAIQEYIYSKEDPRIIADYLAKFSGLTRMILNYSKQEFIYLSEELDFLESYISLQQVRFEVPFEFELNVDKQLRQQDVMLPPLLTQPFIENAIEHGLLHRKTKGHISLSIEEKEGQIHITVEDDGIGRKQAAALKKRTSHQSMATQITTDRLKLLQKGLKRKTKLLITDLFDGHSMAMGTRVSLFLPLIKE